MGFGAKAFSIFFFPEGEIGRWEKWPILARKAVGDMLCCPGRKFFCLSLFLTSLLLSVCLSSCLSVFLSLFFLETVCDELARSKTENKAG